MILTDENKAHIDALSYEELLRQWRFATAGNPWFQGATGDYWQKRMAEKAAEPGHVAASKRVGWEP